MANQYIEFFGPNQTGGTASGGGGGGSGDVAGIVPIFIGPFGNTPNSSGATYASSTLTLQPANATNPGGLTASAQTIGGIKNFSSGIRTVIATSGVSVPPTQLELYNVFGATSSVGPAFMGILNVGGSSGSVYQVYTDGTKYWYIAGTSSGAGGGGGNVVSGGASANQLAYWTDNGTTIAGLSGFSLSSGALLSTYSIGIEAGAGTSNMLRVRGQDKTTASQYGVYVDTIISSSASANGAMINLVPQMSGASSYTVPMLSGLDINASARIGGSSGTATRARSLLAAMPTIGGANAGVTDVSNFSGSNWIYQGGTNPNLLTGPTTLASSVILSSQTGSQVVLTDAQKSLTTSPTLPIANLTSPVACEYRIGIAQDIAVPASSTIKLCYAQKIYDTDDAATTATGGVWKFTVPVGKGGFYNVRAGVSFKSAAWANPNYIGLYAMRNGAYAGVMNEFICQGTFTSINELWGSCLVQTSAGDVLDVQVIQTASGTRTLDGTLQNYNYLQISRAGL